MRTKIVFLLMFLSFLSARAQRVEQLLTQLDEAVANSSLYEKKKQEEIDRLKGNLKVATQLTDRYLSMKQIAHSYIKFHSDSALVYLQRCYNMGKTHRQPEWMQEAVIYQSYILADRGDLMQSKEKLEELGSIDKVAPSLRRLYAEAALMRIGRYENPGERVRASAYTNKMWSFYSGYLKPNSAQYFLYKVITKQNKRVQETIDSLKSIQQHIKPKTYEDALVQVSLYALYDEMGQKDEALRHLIRAAIADVCCANRSSNAMITLINILTRETCSLDRLWNYIALCNNNIAIYKDTGRSVALVQSQMIVQQTIRASSNFWKYVGITAIVVLFSVLFILFLYINKVRKRTHSQQIAQNQLQAQIDLLQQEVEEAYRRVEQERQTMHFAVVDTQKRNTALNKLLAMIGSMYTDVRKYKRNIANLLQAGSIIEARKLANDTIIKDNSVELMYKRFDEVFLTLHPDFIDKFNALLQPDSRIVPETEDTLTPELRIYALISLGVTDSVGIAEILQYSPQTVYNYRLKIRHATITPKLEIAKIVEKMYGENNAETTTEG